MFGFENHKSEHERKDRRQSDRVQIKISLNFNNTLRYINLIYKLTIKVRILLSSD